MNRERTTWLAIGMLITSAACVGFGALALSGFAAAPQGDVVASSGGSATNLVLVIGAAVLLFLEWAHSRRRPARAARPIAVGSAFEA